MMIMEDREFNLWKLLEVIARRIKFILVFVLVITLISVAISLLLPKWYQASTLVLPPRQEGFKLGWSGSLDEMVSLTSGLQLPMMVTPTDIYARILRSRTLAERIGKINRLEEYYSIRSTEDLVVRIIKRSRFHVTPEGLLEISYLDRNPELAAQIANSFADELDRMNREIATSRARTAREFIENRLDEVSRDLDSARTELRAFQNAHKAIDLDKQTQLAIEAAVGLKVDLAKNEIDLNVKEKSLSPTHPEVIDLRRRINEIKKQINLLEFGGNDSSYLNLPISEVPVLKIKYAELTSRLQVSETLYRILSEQYEQAKIQEKMNTPTISIIDRAHPPELPVRPQKRIIVGATFVLSLIIAVFLALLHNYLQNLKERSPGDYGRAQFFYATLFGWLPWIKRASKTTE